MRARMMRARWTPTSMRSAQTSRRWFGRLTFEETKGPSARICSRPRFGTICAPLLLRGYCYSLGAAQTAAPGAFFAGSPKPNGPRPVRGAWYPSSTSGTDPTLLWDTLAEHPCGTLFWTTLVRHSCGTLLSETLVGLFWDTLLGHSCRTLLWDAPVGQSCRTLL